MVRTFKDFVAQDVQNIYLNLSEFGETANINGKITTVVIENEGLSTKNVTVSGRLDINDRLSNGDVMFSVARNFFDDIPRVERPMDFNGTRYRIADVRDDLGMLAITLSRYTG